MPPAAKTAASLTYQLKITLLGTRPPVWRRIRVPASLSLAGLHSVIQVAFGWTDSHLHEFGIDGERYGDGEDNIDESGVKLEQALDGVEKFDYTYDFGDDWAHEILVEKAEPGERQVVCLAGKRNGPPEDCGGAYGYTEVLKVLAGPKGPRYKETVEWLGSDFDPEAFSIAAINRFLGSA